MHPPHTRTRTSTHIHTYTYTNTHTCTHTHTHTHTQYHFKGSLISYYRKTFVNSFYQAIKDAELITASSNLSSHTLFLYLFRQTFHNNYHSYLEKLILVVSGPIIIIYYQPNSSTHQVSVYSFGPAVASYSPAPVHLPTTSFIREIQTYHVR